MEITSFRQLAQLGDDDIAYVGAALDTFPDRIIRDDWMDSASQLHREQYGESVGRSGPNRVEGKGAKSYTVAPIQGAPAAAPSKEEATRQMESIAKRTRGSGEVVKDNLQEIHGIGPKISKLLQGMDITSFAQVARFETADIATVGAALETFPDRIERDDWMSSARTLHQNKYGNDPLKG